MMLRANRADKDRLQAGLAVFVQEKGRTCVLDHSPIVQHQNAIGDLVQVVGNMG